MKIEIEMPEWKCENLLSKNGFITEEVTAYYDINPNPYKDDKCIEDLKPIKVKIAYKKHSRPNELKNEHPMLEVINDFRYEKVVKNVFNQSLWKVLMDC